jgi:molybdate/tungstate transport system substrate-binding protein
MKYKLILLCTLLIVSGCLPRATPAGVVQPDPTTTSVQAPIPLVVFAAGSLIVPFDALAEAFEEQNPHIDVRPEYHGSIQVARHVAEIHDEIDVAATADAALIPMLMYAAQVPETGEPYADWRIRFATNRLALAYTDTSARADQITGENWYEILSDRSVRMGLSDPRFDASGYRTLMAFALAQEIYGESTIFRQMFEGRFTQPITIFVDDDQTTITVPEILEMRPDASLLLRGSSIQLIALLQSGDIDYAFEYESVIAQHGLRMVRLPDAVSLGEKTYQDTYQRVWVELDFRRFATVQPEFQGETIGYGITIPSNARHPQEAAAFIAFLLGPEGRAVMAEHHHPLLDPPTVDYHGRLPAGLQDLCVAEGSP